MRIAINCQILSVNRVGVGRYTENLVNALAAVDRENEYVLLVSSRVDPAILPSGDNVSIVSTRLPIVGTKTRILWEQFWLPVVVASQNVDLVHFPDLSLPILPLLRCPYVVTVHDLTHYAFREAYTLGKFVYKRCTTPVAVRRARRMIADSESTKRDILAFFDVQEHRIATVYPGLTGTFRPIASQELAEVRARLCLPERYILHVGSIDPRKNLVTLLNAYARLVKEDNLPHSLVVVGPKEFNYGPILEAAQGLNLQERLRFLGFVDDRDLVVIYNLAELFVFPSIHEGFGFPVLEAMACGVPVITSNASSLPEVVGDAALLVDPLDIGGLMEAIRRVLADDRLRQAMVEKGLQQASLFTWERAARQTLQVYKDAVAVRAAGE